MGCFIFHDIQAGKFNIDHVVVSPGGVFAIETKSRLKPVTGGGMRDAEVTYDGVSLKFPGWSESKPLQQAKAQSKWLGSQLSRSTGDDVQVRAVLALPGWYVNPKARGDVIVLNPKNCGWMAKMAESNGLDETVMKRICFQLEKLCTDKKR
jgi:hypothetical protein